MCINKTHTISIFTLLCAHTLYEVLELRMVRLSRKFNRGTLSLLCSIDKDIMPLPLNKNWNRKRERDATASIFIYFELKRKIIFFLFLFVLVVVESSECM